MDMLLRAAQQSPNRISENWSAAQGLASMAVALPTIEDEMPDAKTRTATRSQPRRSVRRRKRVVGAGDEDDSGESREDASTSDGDTLVNVVSPSLLGGSLPKASSSLLAGLQSRSRPVGGNPLDGLSLLSRSAPAHASMLERRPSFSSGSLRARSCSGGFMDLDDAHRPPPPKLQRSSSASAADAPVVDARRSSLVDGVPQPLCLDSPPRPLLYEDLINFPRSRGKAHARRCVMCGHLASGDDATCSIPLQNKDVCKRCDTGIWRHTQTLEYFKWCKGCKKFLHVNAFKEKLAKCTTKYSKQPSKCDRCRERGRQSYMSKRMEAEPAPTA